MASRSSMVLSGSALPGLVLDFRPVFSSSQANFQVSSEKADWLKDTFLYAPWVLSALSAVDITNRPQSLIIPHLSKALEVFSFFVFRNGKLRA